MAFENYAALKAASADFLNRKDLTASIPSFVALAEAQMMRSFVQRVRDGKPIPRRLTRRTDATLGTGQEYASVPADFAGPKSLFLATSHGPGEVKFLDYEELQQKKTHERLIGRPRYYTVVGGEFQFYPVSDGDYPIELTYVARFAMLSDTNATNWILADHPDAYLYSTLLQSAPYLKDDARANTWAPLFQNAVDGICSADPMPPSRVTLKTDIPPPRRFGCYSAINDC